MAKRKQSRNKYALNNTTNNEDSMESDNMIMNVFVGNRLNFY
jgi:hypothetical protein